MLSGGGFGFGFGFANARSSTEMGVDCVGGEDQVEGLGGGIYVRVDMRAMDRANRWWVCDLRSYFWWKRRRCMERMHRLALRTKYIRVYIHIHIAAASHPSVPPFLPPYTHNPTLGSLCT